MNELKFWNGWCIICNDIIRNKLGLSCSFNYVPSHGVVQFWGLVCKIYLFIFVAWYIILSIMVGLTLIACPAICWWNPVLSSYRLHCSTSLVSWWLHVWNAQCLQKKISKLSTQVQILYAIKINFTSIFDLYKEFLFYFYYSLGLEIATPIDYIFCFFFFGGGRGWGGLSWEV